jgi:hypothetical protein
MEPLVVEFPLRGEWTAATTPAHRVPSHGTDLLGMTYAFDFVRLDWRRPGIHLHTRGALPYLFGSIPLQDCPGWGQGIYAPFDAEVVEVIDGIAEPDGLNFFRDSFRTLLNELSFSSRKLMKNYREYSGNYVVVQGESCCAAFAHEKCDSIRVQVGQTVRTGELIAEVGHSGNSGAPHLHFQLMDHPDISRARGLPCCFREYEVFENQQWSRVEAGVPQRWQRMRIDS